MVEPARFGVQPVQPVPCANPDVTLSVFGQYPRPGIAQLGWVIFVVAIPGDPVAPVIVANQPGETRSNPEVALPVFEHRHYKRQQFARLE